MANDASILQQTFRIHVGDADNPAEINPWNAARKFSPVVVPTVHQFPIGAVGGGSNFS